MVSDKKQLIATFAWHRLTGTERVGRFRPTTMSREILPLFAPCLWNPSRRLQRRYPFPSSTHPA